MSQASTPDGDDRKKLMAVLVPAGGAAIVIILVAVILALSDSPADPSDKDKGKGKDGGGSAEVASATVRSDLSKLTDGTEPGAEDPNLKDGPHGLKYRDLKEGTGPEVPAGATIKLHYTGWLTNGTIFDSSVKKRQPAEFALGGLIRGWQLGIPGVKVGGVRKLVIPSDLGYGPGGSPPNIPGGATLVFEVEVLALR